MGILDKNAEKAAAKQSNKEQRAKEREQAQREAERQRAEQLFWSSPQGQARAARALGSTLFQVDLPLSATERTFAGVVSGDKTVRRREIDPTDVLGVIEAEGWDLWNVGYVFRETGSVSRDKMMSSGQTAAVLGEIVGIYLFRISDRAPDSSIPPTPG